MPHCRLRHFESLMFEARAETPSMPAKLLQGCRLMVDLLCSCFWRGERRLPPDASGEARLAALEAVEKNSLLPVSCTCERAGVSAGFDLFCAAAAGSPDGMSGMHGDFGMFLGLGHTTKRSHLWACQACLRALTSSASPPTPGWLAASWCPPVTKNGKKVRSGAQDHAEDSGDTLRHFATPFGRLMPTW